MNQSDSPDFEFDISNLEVEGDKAPASEKGEPTPKSEPDQPSALSDKETGEEAIGQFEDDGDEELKGFAIDDMPDVSEPSVSSVEGMGDEPPQPASSESESEDPTEPNPVTRIEPEKEAKPSRTMGEDDLGADVFAEMESDPSMMSLDDVIDDLMEEVEEFEAGGFVDLDEEGVETQTEEGDGLFKLDDPDDSLVHSVDPNAIEAELEPEPAPSFPAPPVYFEIPADPEPEEDEPSNLEEPDQVPADSQPSPIPQPVAARKPAPTPEPAKPAAKQVPDFSDFEIPADPVLEESPKESVEPDLPEAVAEATEEEPIEAELVPEVQDVDEPETDLEENASSGDGFENVFFDAAEESVPEKVEGAISPEEEAEAGVETPEALSETPPVEAEVDASNEDLSPEPEAPENADLEPKSEEDLESDDIESIGSDASDDLETEPDEESLETTEEEEVSAEESDESESEDEDLSALLDAISEEEDEELEATESDSDDSTAEADSETEPSPEIEPEGEVDSEADDANEAEEIPADEEQSVEPDAEDEGDEDDLSDLVAAAIEEDTIEENAAEEETELEELDSEDEEVASPSEESSEPEEDEEDAEPAAQLAPDLAILDEEDEISEELQDSDPEVEADADPTPEEEPEAVSEESEEPSEEEPEPAVALSSDDLLKQAGSLLDAEGGKKPLENANDLLNDLVVEDDDDEVVAMPDPAAMIEEAEAEADEDDEVVAMPDPASLLAEVEEESEEAEEEVKSGNIADRAGDLPPPPPAPVEIIDEEPPEEDLQAAPEEEESTEDEFDAIAGLEEVSDENSDETQSDEGTEDPFDKEISLEDFDEDLDGLGGLDADAAESQLELSAEEAAAFAKEKSEQATKVVEMPKPGLLWRLTHSLSIAAGLMLIGLASVLAVWKQQIVEYIEGRDLDGSALISEIKEIGTHALSDLDQNGLYRMKWVDSEVRRISENEIRLGALVGAQLQENLYRPVLESELDEAMQIDEASLLESLALAHDEYPEEISRYPEKPWKSLYRIAANKEEIVPLKVTYGLTRESEDADWELTKVKVAGYREELKWPEGQPRHAFGEDAYDVETEEFAKVFESYKKETDTFIAAIEKHQSAEAAALLAKKREVERQRERVRMALAEGTYFNGVAIIGEDASDSRDIQLVITEVRGEGAFIKGVVKMGNSDAKTSKHFVGQLDFEETLSGQEQGFLKLTTVSVDLPEAPELETAFFEPRTISRMKLKADGFRLEGDSRDLSLRLTRSF